MNKIIKLNSNLSGEISYADESVVKGFVTKGSTTVEDVVRIKLSKVLKVDQNGLPFITIGEKLVFLANEIINKSSKKEILFLDSWPRDNTFKNVAIVIKIDDNESKIKLNNKNGIVIFCGCSILESKMILDMNRIELIDFATTSLNQKSFDISDFNLIFDKQSGQNMELKETIEMQIANDFETDELVKKSKPAFDFRRRGERLQLSEFSEFVMHFNKFLKEKSRARESVFALGQNLIEKQSGDTFGADFKLMVSIRDLSNTKFIESGAKVTISSLEDNDITFPGKIEYSKSIDFGSMVQSEVSSMKDREQKLSSQSLEKSNKILNATKENELLELQRHELHAEKQKLQELISDTDNQLNSLKQLEKKLEQKIKNSKPKKSKKKKQSLDKNSEITITRHKDEKNKVLKSIKELETHREIMGAKYQKILGKHEEIVNSVNKNANFIEREKISKKDIDVEYEVVSKMSKKIEAEWKRIENKNFAFYEIKFKSFHKEGKPKFDFSLEPMSIQKGEFQTLFNPKYVISSFDYGTLVKFKRYDNALTNIRGGYYKNPYLALSLLRPSLIDQTKFNEVITEIESLSNSGKNNLNVNQKKAVAKALASNDISYIQGPPGTGKTETISAIAQLSVSKGESLLISSSTHAAIDNFFERLDKTYSENPNIFMLRYVHKKKDDRNYCYEEKDIYPRFLNAIDKNAVKWLSNAKESNLSKEEIIDRLKKLNEVKNSIFAIHDKKIENIKMADETSLKIFVDWVDGVDWEKLFKTINKFEDIDASVVGDMEDLIFLHKTKSKIDLRKFAKNFDSIIQPFLQLIKNNDEFISFNSELNFLIKAFALNESESVEKVIDCAQQFVINDNINNPIGADIFNKFVSRNSAWRALINKSAKMDSNNQTEVDDFKFVNTKKNADREEETFLKLLLKNQLLNIIGITTTSIKKIKFANDLVDLFSEYSIDRVIIDEVSKSNTPEIISNILMASKVTLAGDYRQLNPIFDVTDDLLEDFVQSQYYFEWIRRNRNALNVINIEDGTQEETENESISQTVKITRRFLEKLYENSLFKNQIKEISSNQGDKLNSYQYLTEQYRFTDEINELVNAISYRGKEALTAMNKNLRPQKLVIGGRILSHSLNVVDTSTLTGDYIEFLKEIANNEQTDKFTIDSLQVDMPAFDQWAPIIRYRIRKENSLINEFNAYVVCEIVSSILSSNSDAKNENIGVIVMTASQVKIVDQMLKRKKIHGVKVDTVDNFQGREKDIIIVDLVRAKNNFVPNSEISGKIIDIEQRKRNLDFYRKPERFNVAISRAKSKLILVGDFVNNLSPIESIVTNDNGIDEKIKMFACALKLALENVVDGEKGVIKWTK